ncbi:MAG: sodium:proton antiporter [Candidatus Sumerlaeia bacterium]|nr:sodium:proton antiporter [Candidatus Sumerlaeia bacterium]
MTLVASLLVAALVGAGVYQLFRKSAFEVLLGLLLISQAVNLAILAAGGWTAGTLPPVTAEPVVDTVGGTAAKVSRVDPALYVDPLPHALILTAIVIGFGVFSFLMVLIARGRETSSTLALGEPGPGEGKG